MAKLIGSLPNEVVVMNSLTVNLHIMLTSFYRPTNQRFKILIEKKSFPSDYHAVYSQIKLHGFDPVEALIEIKPFDDTKDFIDTSDVINMLAEHGDSIQLVLLSGVQYYNGQVFNIQEITQKAHDMGCFIGFDLAHAVGNIELKLHDWECDFAVWCRLEYITRIHIYLSHLIHSICVHMMMQYNSPYDSLYKLINLAGL